MTLADTSAVVQIVRDKSGEKWEALQARFPGTIAVTHFTRLEIMMGAKDDRQWRRLDGWMSAWPTMAIGEEDWKAAARIWMDLRRRGLTVSDPIDCCIAQAALSRGIILLHRDRDFESIRAVRESLSLAWAD